MNSLNQRTSVATAGEAFGNTPVPDRDPLTFTYNANNRPISVSKDNRILEAYTYDHQGRRILKGDTVTIYDDYNAITVYTTHNIPNLINTFGWGLDLSGNLQDAGGIGGLITVKECSGQTPQIYYPSYDGNGNISEYLNTDSSIIEHYEYDSFGKVRKQQKEKPFVYQFSTKPIDFETGLNYYNYRNYDSTVGRWIGKDPLEENGGINLYHFVENNAVNTYDLLGLEDFTCKEENLGQISNINYTFTYFYGAVLFEIKDPEGYIKDFIWDKAKGEAMDGAGKMSKWAEKAKKGWEFSKKTANQTTGPLKAITTQTTTLANHFWNLFIEIKGECCVCRNGHYYTQDIKSTASDDGSYPMFKPELKLIDHDSMDRLVQSIVSMVDRAGNGFRDACDERVKVNFED